MQFLDIGLKRPEIIPPTNIMTMSFIIMKLLECLQVMKDVDIGILRPDTLPLTIMDFIIVVIKLVTMVEVYVGLKRQSTLPFAIMDQ